MSVTFDQLVARVKQQLMGFAMNQESYAEVSSGMGPEDTAFFVHTDTVSELSRGLVEVEDELVLVKNYDAATGRAVVLGGVNGRGMHGTTAALHPEGVLVTIAPGFPRARIKEAINDTVLGLYPDLVVFGTTEITRVSVQFEYELPEDVRDVWYVTGETLGPSKVWVPLPNWRYNPKASTTDFPSGKSLQQLDPVSPGQKIRVVYAKAPAAMSADTDDFETVTGFPERIVDLVTYGAMKRLLPALETARLQQRSIEATERAQVVQETSATKAVGMYASLYTERLEEERERMFREHPNYQFFQGS